MNFRRRIAAFCCSALWLGPNATAAAEPAQRPSDYYAEPASLPFDEEPIEKRQEAGWHWTEFRFTSLVYHGEPIRIHAIFAAPDLATADNKAPLIISTLAWNKN